MLFRSWWIYFAHEVGDLLGDQTSPYLWGYGHYIVFASAASIGAGAEVVAAWISGSGEVSARLAAASVTVPTAILLLVVWGLQARHFKSGLAQAIMPITAAAVLLCSFAGSYAVFLAGLCCAAAVVCGIYVERLGPIGSEPSGS